MQTIPAALLNSLEDVPGFDRLGFEAVHRSGPQVTSIRINPAKPVPNETLLRSLTMNDVAQHATSVPWSDVGLYLDYRPSFTFDPLFHAGCYYVQEASSMFTGHALQQLTGNDGPLKVLDLCAAPGGKSTHIQSLLPAGSLLVSNDVIRARASVLKDNVIKWGCSNVVVTNNDPRDFAKLENYFDVIVVDAPCSGSGLFRRDASAIEEWSEENVTLCSQRQHRILADAWPCLKKDGLLLYSTCSYSAVEDEVVCDWILQDLHALSVDVPVHDKWNIVATTSNNGAKGYRFWPHHLQGEGFFLAAFRKQEGSEAANVRSKNRPANATKAELSVLNNWMLTEENVFIKHESTIYAWPAELYDDFCYLLSQLRLVYSGVLAGEVIRDKLIPEHALAMSLLPLASTPQWELPRADAIRYLQRREIGSQPPHKGWQCACYEGQALGWTNALSNRVNNYYPKQLRILKDL